jgi:hypothetical protein
MFKKPLEGTGKPSSKAFSSAKVMFSRWRPPLGLDLSALSPPGRPSDFHKADKLLNTQCNDVGRTRSAK